MYIGFSTTNRSEIKEKQLATSVEHKLKNHFLVNIPIFSIVKDFQRLEISSVFLLYFFNKYCD
jgi:hypothetical protein